MYFFKQKTIRFSLLTIVNTDEGILYTRRLTYITWITLLLKVNIH